MGTPESSEPTAKASGGNGHAHDTELIAITGAQVADRIEQLGTLLAAEGVPVDPTTCLASIGLGIQTLLAAGASPAEVQNVVAIFLDLTVS